MHSDPPVVGQPCFDVEGFAGRVVVHHQVELDVGVGPGDMLEEHPELLVTVALFA